MPTTTRKLPASQLETAKRTVGTLRKGERGWIFKWWLKVDAEGSVWVDRNANAYRYPLPGLCRVWLKDGLLHIKMPRSRYPVSPAPTLDDDRYIPVQSVRLFWSFFVLIGFA